MHTKAREAEREKLGTKENIRSEGDNIIGHNWIDKVHNLQPSNRKRKASEGTPSDTCISDYNRGVPGPC